MDSWNSPAACLTTAFLPGAPSTGRKASHNCAHCEKRYASVRNLNRHLRRAHDQQVDDGVDATGGGLPKPTAPTKAHLANSEPFFVNRRGRYQFNTNEDRRHVNCPFCILHRTSLHGLAKHCSAQHKLEYQDWRSGQYGRVQLRRVPPSDAQLRHAMELLLEAGLLDPAVPMESPAELEAAAAAKPAAASVVKRRRSKLRANLPNSRRGLRVEAPFGSPRLPPCPPLVDCRGVQAARQDETPHDAVQQLQGQQAQQLDQTPYHQQVGQGEDLLMQFMYRAHEAESRAFAEAQTARHRHRLEQYQQYHHVPNAGYLSLPPSASYAHLDYMQQQRQQRQSELLFSAPRFYDGPSMSFDGYVNNSCPYY